MSSAVSLTASQEQALAERILEAEAQARAAIFGTPVERMLAAQASGRERTRGKRTERLGEAVAKLQTLAEDDASLRENAVDAGRHWDRSTRSCWELALSARDVVNGEAAKLGCPLLERADLVQEGTVGAMMAARRFEPARGVRYRTYARWWIRAHMRDAIRESRTIRLPASATKLRSRLSKQMDATDGTAHRPEQAAMELGEDPKRAAYVMAFRQPDSLDAPVDGDPSLTRAGVLHDEEQPTPLERVTQREQADQLHQAIDDALPPRSQDILGRRYGLAGQQRETLASIAEDYDITPQRVRQIQRAAESRVAEWCRMCDAVLPV